MNKSEKSTLIKRLVNLYPYPVTWFERQNITVLNAMYKKSTNEKISIFAE